MRTSRSGWPYGSGCSTTAWRTEKTAVFAPIPNASVATTIAANRFADHRVRAAVLRSPIQPSTWAPLDTTAVPCSRLGRRNRLQGCGGDGFFGSEGGRSFGTTGRGTPGQPDDRTTEQPV